MQVVQPLVSILIPAFNSQQWIADTLRSAIGQTWRPTEIIVVDDGSTDRTLAVARRFEPQGVRVVPQLNQGAAAARNKAFSLCQGDYIQWLDSDDLLAPDKIERQMEAAEQHRSPCTIFSSAWGTFLCRADRARFIPTALWCDLSPVEFLLRKLEQNLWMQTATWLVSRELSEAAGPWDIAMAVDDDGEYFSRLLLRSDGIRFVPDARVYYRSSGTHGLSHIGLSGSKIDAQWRSLRLHIEYLRRLEESPRSRAACVRLLQNWLGYFYALRPDIVRQAEQLSAELGGRLEEPRLSPKYAWIKALFGWGKATRAQLLMTRLRWTMKRWWDGAFGVFDG